MRWVNKPPIEEVSDDEAKTLFLKYQSDMKDWITKAQPGSKKSVGLDDEQKKWNSDIGSRIEMAEFYKHKGIKVVYKLASGPAAFMLLVKRDEDVRIENLSAHVGATGAGPIMIEWAVNFSASKGCDGKVTLFDASGNDGFYKNLGFHGEEKELKIDPNKSDLWVCLDTQWILAKYQPPRGFVQNLT